MSTVLHGIFESRPFVCSLSTVDIIWHLRSEIDRDLAETKEAREYAREKERLEVVQIAQEIQIHIVGFWTVGS